MIIIDMPAPPSANFLWRFSRANGKAYLSPQYKRWQQLADAMFLSQKRSTPTVGGKFKARVIISDRVRGDIDNRCKAALDCLQRWGIVRNDADCVEVTVTRGEAPEGCRVIVEAA